MTSIKNVSKYAVEDDMQFEEDIADSPSPKKNSERKVTYEPSNSKKNLRRKKRKKIMMRILRTIMGMILRKKSRNPHRKKSKPQPSKLNLHSKKNLS